MGLYEFLDEDIEIRLGKLSKKDIKCLDELIKLLRLLKSTNYIEELEEANAFLKLFNDKWEIKETKYPFLKTMNTEIGNLLLNTSYTNYNEFKELYKFVKITYMFNEDDEEWNYVENIDLIDEIIINICQKLIYYVESYDKHENTPKYIFYYFEQFKDVKWKDESVKKFKKEIGEVIIDMDHEIFVQREFLLTINNSANFLMICNVVKDNRQLIEFTDVVAAYLTILKMIIKNPQEIMEDIEVGKIVKIEKKALTMENICWAILIIWSIIMPILMFISRSLRQFD